MTYRVIKNVPARGFVPAFTMGEIVYRYRGCTYGCVDYKTCEAVSFEEDVEPFLEIPRDAIAPEAQR
jgi:hypothetical protein